MDEGESLTATSEVVSEHSSKDENTTMYSCNQKNGARFDKRTSRCLVELSEEIYDNEVLSDKVYVGGTLEKFDYWENNAPNPKYVVPKRKKTTSEPSEIVNSDDHGKTENDPFVHCYEIEFVECPAWQIGVEPLTYRYINNHGRYRAYKLGQRLVNANNRLRNNGKVNYDRHKLRNAIHIELKKEFETFIQYEKQRQSLLRQQELAQQKQRKKALSTKESNQDKQNAEQTVEEPFKLEKEAIILDSDDTPRTNISVLSSHTPLPPIGVPLVSSEDSDAQQANVTTAHSTTEYGKPQKLWHIPSQISVNKDAEILLRHRSAPKQLQNFSYSEPASRVSSRNSTTRGIKDGQIYRLKKLPTIADFHEENIPSQKDSFMTRRMSQPVTHVASSRNSQMRSDDTMSVTSEPPMATTPVLQGTAYDINKLRTSTNDMFGASPEVVTVLNDMRAYGEKPSSYEKAPLRYIAAKYRSEHQDKEEDNLEDVITTKQYVSSKTRTGLNPYLRKPKIPLTGQAVTVDSLETDFGDAFRTLPITKKAVTKTVEDDIMPEMLVRRAEIAVTNKRVI